MPDLNNEYRLVPNDEAAERAVLGSILFDTGVNNNALVTVQAILEPADFYRTKNQEVFKAMALLADEERPIEPLTLQDKLNAAGQLENVGGVAYLTELVESAASAANAKYYAQIVHEKAVLRRLIQTLSDSMSLAYEGAEDSSELLEKLNHDLDKLAENQGNDDLRRIKDVLNEFQQTINEAAQQDGDIIGLSSGFKDLDEYTQGFREDQMIVIGARPAVGKTAFVLNVAEKVASAEKVPVVVFSLEMGAVDLVTRLVAAKSGIDAKSLITGKMADESWRAMTVAMQNLATSQIYLDDTPGIRMSQISAKLRKLEHSLIAKMTPEEKEANPHPLGMVMIDYLGLIESSTTESRQQAVSEVSRSIKKLAKELHTPIIALAQLSRGVEQRQDKRPILSDLRESGSIEQDADIVAFLYRKDYHHDGENSNNENQEEEEQDVVPVEVILEKNRAGARGKVELMFNKPTFKFSAMAPNSWNNN